MNARSPAHGSIAGVVSAVPTNVVTNADCPNPEDARTAAKLTGVTERRWARQGQTAAALCTAAARRLLEGLRWEPESIDILVFVTQTPSDPVPADVFRIAADLGMPPSCVCLQVNWSCAGYVYGLWTAMRLLHCGQRALLLVGDVTSSIADPADRATAPLFGDAGSATAIEGGYRAQHFVLGSDGSGADKLAQAPGDFLRMDGAAVFNFTLQRVPELVDNVLALRRADYLLFHQANRMMLAHLVKKAGLLERFEPAQIPINVTRFGNCSCASIPLLLCSELAAEVRRLPTRLALLGFGAGWAWAGANIDCSPLDVVELIEV